VRPEKTSSDFIARFGDGEKIVTSIDALEECVTSVVEKELPELWLIPSSKAGQLGSLALRVFGLKPRPAVIAQFGPGGALVTFRDRIGGDYRVVNRDFDGQASRGDFVLHDKRRIPHRADEVFAIDEALGFVRDFHREGDRPWRLSCRPVAV
jgi:hypothetical protein